MYSLSELYNLSKDVLVQLVSTIQKETEETFYKRPKLFHVTLPSGMFLGYDSYSEFVCVAFTKEEARKIHPDETDEEWKYRGSWIAEDEIDKLVVEEIGIAYDNVKPGTVVVSSFHAG